MSMGADAYIFLKLYVDAASHDGVELIIDIHEALPHLSAELHRYQSALPSSLYRCLI